VIRGVFVCSLPEGANPMFEPIADEGTGAGKGPRPKLDIPYTQFELYCEIVAVVVLIGIAFYLAAIWTKLPAQIPGHFNIMGQPDRWDGRNSIFWMLGITAALYVGISVLQRFPHIYNYPFGLTPQNVHRQYQLARQLLVLIKTEIVCSFVFIQWGIMHVARGLSQTMGPWVVPIMIVAILTTIVQYCIRASKSR
jgi:uncharacterized membrane protein